MESTTASSLLAPRSATKAQVAQMLLSRFEEMLKNRGIDVESFYATDITVSCETIATDEDREEIPPSHIPKVVHEILKNTEIPQTESTITDWRPFFKLYEENFQGRPNALTEPPNIPGILKFNDNIPTTYDAAYLKLPYLARPVEAEEPRAPPPSPASTYQEDQLDVKSTESLQNNKIEYHQQSSDQWLPEVINKVEDLEQTTNNGIKGHSIKCVILQHNNSTVEERSSVEYKAGNGPQIRPVEEIVAANHMEEIVAAKQSHPMEEMVAARQSNPMQETVAARQPNSVEEMVAARQSNPTEEMVAARQSNPTEEMVAARQSNPTEEMVAARQSNPTEEMVAARQSNPTEEMVAARQSNPTEEMVAARQSIPAEEMVAARQSNPTEEIVAAGQFNSMDNFFRQSTSMEEMVAARQSNPMDNLPGQNNSLEETVAARQSNLIEQTFPKEYNFREQLNPQQHKPAVQQAIFDPRVLLHNPANFVRQQYIILGSTRAHQSTNEGQHLKSDHFIEGHLEQERPKVPNLPIPPTEQPRTQQQTLQSKEPIMSIRHKPLELFQQRNTLEDVLPPVPDVMIPEAEHLLKGQRLVMDTQPSTWTCPEQPITFQEKGRSRLSITPLYDTSGSLPTGRRAVMLNKEEPLKVADPFEADWCPPPPLALPQRPGRYIFSLSPSGVCVPKYGVALERSLEPGSIKPAQPWVVRRKNNKMRSSLEPKPDNFGADVRPSLEPRPAIGGLRASLEPMPRILSNLAERVSGFMFRQGPESVPILKVEKVKANSIKFTPFHQGC